MTATTTTAIVVMALALSLGLLFMVTILSVLKSHRVVLRSKDSNHIEGYYYMKPVKDKLGDIIWWKSVFWQRRLTLPEPPDESVFINRRGKKWVEAYRLSEDEVVFLKDSGLNKNKILESNGKKVSECLTPFSVVDRQVLINQQLRADARRKNSWLRENAMNLISLSVLALVVVMFMVYWGDFSQFALQKDAASTGLLKEAKSLLNDARGVTDVMPAATSPSGTIVQQGTEAPPR